ncbi:phage holin family protein [Dolosicoccus paucivorans]|uniref:phage holin family protein n=1 Tax=Dolosicoccus paucivorans TaxID=84521 RepID=UPI0008812AA6|nr:phage holin family protein [Dolosicoccus paucivorans]SDI79977.1 Phage holin family Hol44, holin superfamily V [Dolosicoccus paucivorans]
MALNPLITLISYLLGYTIKTTPLTQKYTHYIPIYVALLGGVLGYLLNKDIVLGILSGLASTGIYESVQTLLKEAVYDTHL